MIQHPNIPQLIYSLSQYFDLPVERLPAIIWLLLQLLPVVIGLGVIFLTALICGLVLLLWRLRELTVCMSNQPFIEEGQR